MDNSCDCSSRKIVTFDDIGRHHHRMCGLYKTEKHTYLFYYSDGFDAWIPASEKIENTVDVADFDKDEEREIKFKRVDLTDKEYAELKDE